MIEQTVPRRAAAAPPGRALLASIALAGLAGAFAWAAPDRNGWAGLALALALVLDGSAQATGAWLARRGDGLPRIVGLPSLVLAFGPGSGLGALLFAAALLVWPAGFPVLASALAGLIAMGAIARLVLAWIVLRIPSEPEA